jgi:hypothetical protein
MPPLAFSTRIGILDGVVFFCLWAAVALFSASNPMNAVPYIAFGLLPVACYVGWQGSRSVPRILGGQASWSYAALVGFLAGVALAAFALVALYAHDATAAGQLPFDYFVLYRLLPLLPIAGLVGALHGIAFLVLNKLFIRALNKNGNNSAIHSNG